MPIGSTMMSPVTFGINNLCPPPILVSLSRALSVLHWSLQGICFWFFDFLYCFPIFNSISFCYNFYYPFSPASFRHNLPFFSDLSRDGSLDYGVRIFLFSYTHAILKYPLSTVFTESHKFWQVAFSSKYILISFKTSLTDVLFRRALFHLQIFWFVAAFEPCFWFLF